MRLESQTAPAPSTELAVISAIHTIVPADFFKPGGNASVLETLKAEVRKQASALDISTEQNRAALASLAYKVARSKTALDEQGKKLTEGLRKQKAEVDAERSRVWDEMEALQKEVRQPLTDWENAEKERVLEHEGMLASLQREINLAPLLESISGVRDAKHRVIATHERNWEEFSQRAAGMKALAFEALKLAFDRIQAAEALRLEEERLLAEAQEAAIKAREEAAARAAKDAAERKAAEQTRIAQEAAERERQRVENERVQAEARAKQAEAQRIAQEQLADRLLKEAEERRAREEQEAKYRAAAAAEQAERDRQAAIEAERQRVAAETRRVAEEAEKRAKNRARQAEVNRAILAAVAKLGIPEDIGKDLVAAMAKGAIPHVKVEY